MLLVYAVTIVTSVLGYFFLYNFMKEFQSIEFPKFEEDFGDYGVAKSTIIVHNIPPDLPVADVNALLRQVFQSIFGENVKSVQTVGDYKTERLDKYYTKLDQIKQISKYQ